MNKRCVPLLLVVLMTSLFSACIEEPEPYPNTKEGNFDALWHLVDTRYCYLDYKQVNWDSIYVAYHQQLNSVHTDVELFDLFASMLNTLQDGHVNLYSSFDKSRYWSWFLDYPSNFDSKILLSDRYLGRNYRMAGGIEYALLEGGTIGYMYYGSFSDEFTHGNIQRVFQAFDSCEGLIVDVRDNGGGSIALAEQLASYFLQTKTLTGYISHKTGDGHSDFSKPVAVYTPAADSVLRWRKPVVVLTNRLSYSATNSFVCRMKHAPNATIVGDRTGGGGGMPLSNELPNGWMVRFSACPMFDANMQHTEWGLDPDVSVMMDSTDQANGFDTLIEAAIDLIDAN